jgi:hypothetical protein
MKKTLFYSFLAVFFAANLSAQNVNIPDANFKNALLKYTKINTNADTEIQVSEATAYSDSIDVSGTGIINLTGIEAFIHIKKLNCSGNQLPTLDVSKNTALNTLHCAFGKLSALDVSKNIALTDLRCNSNKIMALDISKNIALTYLNCGTNALTTLDVSKNLALTTLGFYSNKLKIVDVSKNTALTTLNCYLNLDLTVDISKNLALSTLDCGYNKLSALDISKNLALTDLRCEYNQLVALDISKNLALTSLKCSFNPLTTLDLSKHLALTTLECYSSQFTTLDISKNIALTTLICYANQLTNLNVKNAANSKLSSFNASRNPLLKCIQVDDPTKIGANWKKDTTATYSSNCSVATEDATLVQSLMLYPNPTSNTLYVSWEVDITSLHVDLMNSVGAIVKSQQIDNQGIINVSDLPRGFYLCRLSDANHKTQTLKVVVE